MNNAATTRAATQSAQREAAKKNVTELLELTNRCIITASHNGSYQTTVNAVGFTPTELNLVIVAIRKLGYVAKLSSTKNYLDVSW